VTSGSPDAQLPTRRLGRAGIVVSELALGTMTFGREADEAVSVGLLDSFLERGGNLVDTADRYSGGESESILGRALRGRRHDVIVATKFRWSIGPGPNDSGASRRHILRAVEASLRRLQTDWIDLYQVHCWDPNTPLEETLSTLDDLVRSGKVRYLGASNFAAWQLTKALGLAALHRWEPFVAVQPQYSLLVRDIELDTIPVCRADGLGVVVWGPLGGGVLTGKYRVGKTAQTGTRAGDDLPASRMIHDRINERSAHIAAEVADIAETIGRPAGQVALNWVLYRPGVTSVLIGARDRDQLEQNLGAAGWQLSAEHRERLDRASVPRLPYPYDVHQAFGVLD
jgi:aryl-alcohol dehydrogenase-like predicted oxidoreductase